jgi:hypothetical protein
MAAQDATQQSAAQPGDQDQDQDEGQEQQAILVVEVSLMPDGTIKVEKETGAQEAAEQSGGGEQAGDTSPTTVKDAQEAGELVVQYLTQAAQSPEDVKAQNVAQQSAGYQQA